MLEVFKTSLVESWAHGFDYDQYVWEERTFYQNEPVSRENYQRACRILTKMMFAQMEKSNG